jgi:hypothetical protein
MLDEATALPDDPEDLRTFTARLLAEVKAQAILIEKLRHQLAGHRAHRFGASSETAEQLQLALESSEIAAAAMTARLRLPDVEEKDKPKRRPIPDHVPRMEVELTTGEESCSGCGRALRRLGEDITEELEYVPGRFIVNRIVRPRLACSGCERFVQAPLPSRQRDCHASCSFCALSLEYLPVIRLQSLPKPFSGRRAARAAASLASRFLWSWASPVRSDWCRSTICVRLSSSAGRNRL